MEFSDKIALVTGASRGLGRAVAQGLGAQGAQVIAVARTVGGLEEVDDAIRAAGGPGATLVPVDITDDPALSRLGAAIHERWARLDLWIHTAVQAPTLSPAEHYEEKDIDPAIAVNFRATQRLIRVLDPLLRRSNSGRALFFHDPVEPDSFNGAYLSTKAGQAAIVRAWGLGLARVSPARVVMCTPPPMRTALRGRFHPGEDRSTLTHPAEVAARLVEALAGGADGDLDLR